jgi:hypothetical protein
LNHCTTPPQNPSFSAWSVIGPIFEADYHHQYVDLDPISSPLIEFDILSGSIDLNFATIARLSLQKRNTLPDKRRTKAVKSSLALHSFPAKPLKTEHSPQI